MATATFTRAPTSRVIRNVDVAFNVITFSAGLHGAVADQDDQLSSVCSNGHAEVKVRQVDTCPSCGNTDKTTFVRGRVRTNEVTVVDSRELEKIKACDEEFKGRVNVQVVEANDELMVPVGSVYYLASRSTTGSTGYALLAALIRKRPKVAFLAELSMAAAPRLFRLLVEDNVIVLREIARPEALRERPAVSGEVKAAEMKLGEQLVDTSVTPFDPQAFRNRHHAAVQALVEGSHPVAASAPDGSVATNGDLLTQLAASLAAAGVPAKPAARRPRVAAGQKGQDGQKGQEDAPTAVTRPKRAAKKVA